MASVVLICRLRDKLLAELSKFAGVPLRGDDYRYFLESIKKILPNDVPITAINVSGTLMLGVIPDRIQLRDFCWKLAGNLPILKKGISIGPWIPPTKPESVLIQLLDGDIIRLNNNRSAFQYQIRILSGTPCPTIVIKTWPVKYLKVLARTAFGFTRSFGDRPFSHGKQLIKLRAKAKIEAKYCEDGKPGFMELEPSAACLNWNKEIWHLRVRTKVPCPFQFVHPCYNCNVGYDQCPAGTHPKTYEVKLEHEDASDQEKGQERVLQRGATDTR